MQVSFVENIGFAAALCTTLSFVPQLTKIRKQGGRDLSYAMLCVYLLGLVLWLAYGLILHAAAIIVANAVSIVLVVAAIIMKATIAGSPEPPSQD
jgi:MtN3 and saliva related transmembrane protein